MRRQFIDFDSAALSRHMGIIVYGEPTAMPVVMFQSQDGMCADLENFGIINTISSYIDAGRIQCFSVDSVDAESWSDSQGDPYYRADRQEQYYHFVVDELLPWISQVNCSGKLPLSTGFSMGGTHAAIYFLRRPELFSGLLGFSGVYCVDYFFGGFMNPVLYLNAPTDFMRNMAKDHPYIDLYNQKKILFCVGQGDWEEDELRGMRELEQEFRDLNIHASFHYWGFDSCHDWPWWQKQIALYLPEFLDE